MGQNYSAESNGPKFYKTLMFLGQAGMFLSFQARRSSATRSSTSDLTVFSFGRCWGTFGVLTPTTFWGKSFQLRIQQCALCCCHCCGRVAMIVSGFPCTNGRSFLLQSFRHKKVVLFTLSGQFLGWFTLRLSFEAVQWSSFPSFYLYLLFPTACLTFNFSSLLIIPQNPIEGAQGKFKLQRCQTAFEWPNSSEV